MGATSGHGIKNERVRAPQMAKSLTGFPIGKSTITINSEHAAEPVLLHHSRGFDAISMEDNIDALRPPTLN
jgi:hypothetical protein